MDWDQQAKLRNQRKRAHLQASEDTFDEAVELAEKSGSCSLQQMPARYHFQLICYADNLTEYSEDVVEHIYNLYPSTQRIYTDPRHRGPFLKIPKPWTLLDIVKAVMKT